MEQGAEMVVYREEIKDQANLVVKEQLVFFSVSYLLTVWNCSSWLPRRKWSPFWLHGRELLSENRKLPVGLHFSSICHS